MTLTGLTSGYTSTRKSGYTSDPMIRVLVVDDSAVVRHLCEQVLSRDPQIEVVGTAPDPFVARDMILERKPDVLTLDIEMPRMDGITFLKRLMKYHPIPTVVLSSLSSHGSALALEALEAGACAVLSKPGSAYSLGELQNDLIDAVKLAAATPVRMVERPPMPPAFTGAKPAVAPRALTRTTQQILAIGASTGGTVAIETLLAELPADSPGTVITQHMPPVFTASFASRLDKISRLRVSEARDGDVVAPGSVLIAPGGKHLLLRRSGAQYVCEVKDGPLVNGHRPSVDVLFRSVAAAAGRNALGVILTGMGGDGAKGLLEMRRAGAHTIAQDEASCVVFGMPKVAIELDAACEVQPLQRIARRIVENLDGRSKG
jgi:two-component system chemotaxis response regulator CheB